MYQVFLNNTRTMDDGDLLYSDSHIGDIDSIVEKTENGTTKIVTEFSDKKSYRLISPKLTLEDGAAGSFTATVPKSNVLYDQLKPIISTINIYRVYVSSINASTGAKTYSREWLWGGRILTIEKDYYNNKKITCEGVLAFLNDTIPPLHKYSDYNFLNYVKALLSVHFRGDWTTGSAYRPLNRIMHTGYVEQFSPSGVAIPNKTYFTEGSNTVLAYIKEVADEWGLHIRIRKGTFTADSTTVPSYLLDLISDSGNTMHTCSQSIEFGSNLMDYSDKDDWSEMCTVLHPLGKTLETMTVTNDEEHKDRLTIKGKTPSNTTKYAVVNEEYLVNKSARTTYGGIEKTVEWSDIEDASVLMQMAELYMENYQYQAKEIKIKAFDLKYVGLTDVDFFNLLDKIPVKSIPHGYSGGEFIVTKIDIPIEKPEDGVFTFTRSTTGTYGSDGSKNTKSSLTGTSKEVLTKNQIGNVLASAKKNSANLLEMSESLVSGTVILENDVDSGGEYIKRIMITNTRDPNQATQRWVWGMTGLGYQQRSSASASWPSGNTKVALTSDGQIIADAITTGTLTVSDTGNRTLFQASMSSHNVQVAGFIIDYNAIHTNYRYSAYSNVAGLYMDKAHVSIGDGVVSTDLNYAGLTFYYKDSSGNLVEGASIVCNASDGSLQLDKIKYLEIGYQCEIRVFETQHAFFTCPSGTFTDQYGHVVKFRNGLIVSIT